MRYHYVKPEVKTKSVFSTVYMIDHPVYSECTLYVIDNRGLAIVQQKFNRLTKSTFWASIDPGLADDIYIQPGFIKYFKKHAHEKDYRGFYPTVPVRKIMWALRMKPLFKECWETTFDREEI